MTKDDMLVQMERLRTRDGIEKEPADYVIRVCEAIAAEYCGYKNRMEWRHLQERE